MAAEAEKRADVVIVTDDNPRSEDPAKIAADIVQGLSAGVAYRVIHDRAAAIAEAIAIAGANDEVLVAGKGHQAYQERAGRKRPARDAAQARHHCNLTGAV